MSSFLFFYIQVFFATQKKQEMLITSRYEFATQTQAFRSFFIA